MTVLSGYLPVILAMVCGVVCGGVGFVMGRLGERRFIAAWLAGLAARSQNTIGLRLLNAQATIIKHGAHRTGEGESA